MLKYVLVFLFAPMIGLSQSYKQDSYSGGKGINFEKSGSWQKVLEKAKKEGKFIFMDCYTTWCGPCKRMDKEIYPLASVGSVYNKHFISIKVQMDRTVRDSEEIKKWYGDADSIKDRYKVDAYPTYLFFSPEGKLVHRAAGAFSAESFQSLASDALDPQKQSYAENKKFDLKAMSDSALKEAAISYRFSNPDLADQIALEFINRLNNKDAIKDNYRFVIKFNKNAEVNKFVTKYVNSLSNEEMLQLYSRENFSFVTQFMNSSKDRTFTFLLQNAELVDSIMNKGYDYQIQYSYMLINKIIKNEEVMPFLEKAGTSPDWIRLYKFLKGKYNEPYATMNVHLAKMEWFVRKKDKKSYAKQLVLYMDEFGGTLESGWYLNNNAWEIFLYSDNKEELRKALSWSGRAVLNEPTANWMDTYANILYKLGKKTTAIQWEKIAITLEPEKEDFKSNLKKMNSGQPTW